MDVKHIMFHQTLEMNKRHKISCHLCKKENTLMKAHYSEWAYRDAIKGYLCPECKEKYKTGVKK